METTLKQYGIGKKNYDNKKRRSVFSSRKRVKIIVSFIEIMKWYHKRVLLDSRY